MSVFNGPVHFTVRGKILFTYNHNLNNTIKLILKNIIILYLSQDYPKMSSNFPLFAELTINTFIRQNNIGYYNKSQKQFQLFLSTIACNTYFTKKTTIF